jgi:mannose-6-phosphate isomerase-like protein (cupin superfamily)
VEGPQGQVGAAVRAHRTAKGWSMRELARRAGVSQPFITKLERGDQLPSIPTLYDLAAALGVTPSALLPTIPDSAPSAGLTMPSTPGSTSIRLLAGGPGRSLHVYELLVPPGGGDDESFTHPGEEVAVVLEGTVHCLRPDERTVRVPAGDSLTIDPSRAHRWRNEDATPARILLVCDDHTSHRPRGGSSESGPSTP